MKTKMKTIAITFFLLVLFVSHVHAEYILKMKDGKTIIWRNYTEEDDKYCTHRSFGKLCVSKSEVESIKKEGEPESDPPKTSRGKPEREKEKPKPLSPQKEKSQESSPVVATKAKPEREKEGQKPSASDEKVKEGFVFEVTSPRFKVTIPSIPPIKMGPHPGQDRRRPHLRFMGSSEPYTISILTPTADRGMKAQDCASSIIRSLGSRPFVPAADEIYKAKIDENTFVAIYASDMPIPGFVQLHAHFFSAAGGTHCVEVHVSKVTKSKDEIDPWFQGFGKAKIEPY